MKNTSLTACLFALFAGGAFANGSSEVSERGLYRTDSGTNVYEYLLFAPPDFYEDWCWYVRQRKLAHPGVRFAVKNTAAVYAEHPFGTGLACRNAAESLHAYIRAAWTNGVLEYVVLGGAWLDAQDIYGAQPRFATGEALSLSNSVPGVYGYPREDWRAIPADYFYACPGLAAGEKYPWDANGNGKYIDQNDCSKNDLVPRLCVSRITLNPYNGGRDPYNQHELITNYVAKLKRGEAKSFAGHYRYGMSAASTGSSKQRKTGDRMYYRELEFYDGMLNMFDPRHHDTLEDDEYSVRVRTYDQYSMWRPVREVKGMMSYTWTGGLPSLSAAMDDYYAADRDFAYVQAHGWAQGAAQFSAGRFATAKGLTLFNGGSGPCETGYPDYYVNKVLQYNVGDAAVTNPDGGALASVNNSRWSWAGGGGYGAMSYYMLNEMLIGFNKERLDVGHAWLKGCRNYYPVSHSGSTATWVLTEQFLYGDPLVRLPEVPNVWWTGGETGVWDRVTANWTNSVDDVKTFDAASNVYFTVGTNLNLDVAGEIAAMRLSLPVFEEDAVITLAGMGTLRVLQAVDVAGTNATLKFDVAGGVGHNGIRFVTGAGDLVFEGTNKFYVGGVSNAKRLLLRGGGVTVDADEFPKSDFPIVIDGGRGATRPTVANELRTKNVGGLRRFGPLAITNSHVKLSTVDAFGRDEPMTHTLVDSELEIGANVYYQRSGYPEGLNATFLVDGDSAVTSSLGGLWTVKHTTTFVLDANTHLTLSAETVNGGGKIVITNASSLLTSHSSLLTPHSSLLTNSVTVATASALSGDVTIGADVRLILDELPLKSVTSLAIGKDATVELPDDASGYWQIVPVSSKFSCAEGVTFALASDPTNRLAGSPSPTGSFFQEGALYKWTGAEGVWSRSFSIRHPKILFGDLAGTVVTVRVDSAVSPDFAFFSNLKTAYVFTADDEAASVSFSSIYFCGPTSFEVPVAATEYVEVSTATSRFGNVTAPYVHVAAGAGLALAGSHWTDFRLDAGAVLVAVPGEALDWNTETTFAFPDDGEVLVDVGGLELSDEPQTLIAGFGHTWTISDLKLLRLTGTAAEFRIVDGALCVVKGDNLKGPYELALGESTNWNNAAWTATNAAVAARRALPAAWNDCALDWNTDIRIVATNGDVSLDVDADVHANELSVVSASNAVTLARNGDRAFVVTSLDLSECQGAVTVEVETGDAAIATPTNESAVCRFVRAGTGTITLNGSTVELAVPGDWTLANGSQGKLRVVVTQGLARCRLAKLPSNFEDGGLEVEFFDSGWNPLSGFSAEFSDGALWCVPPPITAVVPSGTNEFLNLTWRDLFGNVVSRADFDKASSRLLIGGDEGGVVIATNGFASVLSTLSISNTVTFYGNETFTPSSLPGPGTLELAGAFTVKADVRANNMLLTNAKLKLSDASVLEISHGGQSYNATAQDWSGVTGTGRVRFTDGTASWLAVPAKLFAPTLSVEMNSDLVLTDGIKASNPFAVANLSGGGRFRMDWGTGDMRPVRTVQTRVSAFDGLFSNIGGSRDTKLVVASDGDAPSLEKALVLTATSVPAHALDIEANGCVVLMGDWAGKISVKGGLLYTNVASGANLNLSVTVPGQVLPITTNEVPTAAADAAYVPPAYQPVEPVPESEDPLAGAVRDLTASVGAGSANWSNLDWRGTNGVAVTAIDWSVVTNATIVATNVTEQQADDNKGATARIIFDATNFTGVVHLGRAVPSAAALTVEARRRCPFTLAADSTGAVDFRLSPVPTATCDLLAIEGESPAVLSTLYSLLSNLTVTVHDRYGREIDVAGEVTFDDEKGKYVLYVQNVDKPSVSNTFDTQYDDTLSTSLGFSGSGGLTYKDYPQYFEASRAGRALIGTSKEKFTLHSHNGNPTVSMDSVYVWSINFVVKLPTNDRGIVFGWGNKDSGNGIALVRVSENRAGIYAWKDGGAATLVASANVPSASTQFHAYAITHDKHTLCFYVDGVLAESVPLEGKYPTRGFYQYFKMYGQNGSLSDGPSSVVDDFRLYLNCCLTPASVRAIANAFKPWPEYPSAEVDLPDLAWSNLYWSADRQADDSLTLAGGSGNLRIDAPVELFGSLAVTDGKVPVSFAGDGALVVRGGVTVASSLELDVSSLDGAALAAKAVYGVPYSRWLVRGSIAGDVKVAEPLPAMPHGYTVETEINARFGVRLIVTAPWFAKYRSLNFNFTGGDNNAENTAARVSDQANCKNLMHGAFPIVGTAWTDLPARDQTVDASGVKLVVSGVNNAYYTKTSVGDQILYGYLDDKQHPTVVVSNIPYASYRIVTYHATDNANTYFCPVWMGSTAADAVRYFGPSANVATGGATVWGWSDVSWGDSDCRAALAEGVNYVISDVITGAVGQATAYVRVPRLASGRACLTALQIVEVGEVFVSPAVDYAATVTNDTLWANGDGAGLVHDAAWENDVNSRITLMPAARTASAPYRTITFDTPLTASTVRVVSSADERLGLLTTNALLLTIGSLDLSGSKGETVLTNWPSARVPIVTTAGSRLRFEDDATEPLHSQAGAIVAYRAAHLTSAPNPYDYVLRTEESGDFIHLDYTDASYPALDVSDGTVSLGRACQQMIFGGVAGSATNTVIVVNGGTFTSPVLGDGTTSAKRGLIYGNTGSANIPPRIVVNRGTFEIPAGVLTLWQKAGFTQNGGRVRLLGLHKGSNSEGFLALNGGVFELGRHGIKKYTLEQCGNFNVTLAGGTLRAMENATVSVAAVLSRPSCVAATNGCTLTFSDKVTGGGGLTVGAENFDGRVVFAEGSRLGDVRILAGAISAPLGAFTGDLTLAENATLDITSSAPIAGGTHEICTGDLAMPESVTLTFNSKPLPDYIRREGKTLIVTVEPHAWANPVTGATTDFAYRFTGADDATWKTPSNWRKFGGYLWSSSEKVPMAEGSETWDATVIDGADVTNAANRAVALTAKMEGWTPRLAVFNAATVTVSTVKKLQGSPKWFWVDDTSQLKINAFGADSYDGTTDLYVAGSNGLVFAANPAGSASSSTTFRYYLKDAGTVEYPDVALTKCSHQICRADFELNVHGAGKTVRTKPLVLFDSATVDFDAQNADVAVYDPAEEISATVRKMSALTGRDALGSYVITQRTDGVYLDYVDRVPSESYLHEVEETDGVRHVEIPVEWVMQLTNVADHALAPHNLTPARLANALDTRLASHGMKPWECYVLGLEPTNASHSVTAVIVLSDEKVHVEARGLEDKTFRGISKVRYVLEATDSLANSFSIIRAAQDETTFPDVHSDAGASRFYRVRVELVW